jgi:hypothetical protein
MGEWLVSCAIRLINQCSCGPIYGAYREALFDAATNRELTEHSIILIRPRYALFGLKFGVKIGGLCRNRNGAEVRDFESLSVDVRCKDPITVGYNYWANAKGKCYFNSGFIRFADKTFGKYFRADGYFIMPYSTRLSVRPRNVQINIVWKRICADEIKAKTGKSVLKTIDDIREFFRRGGQL